MNIGKIRQILREAELENEFQVDIEGGCYVFSSGSQYDGNYRSIALTKNESNFETILRALRILRCDKCYASQDLPDKPCNACQNLV